MLDYASLSAVAAIIREGSFDRAAASLGVTRSAISQRVRALEERLGTTLVVRAKPCTATAAGLQLCAHVERVRLLEGEMAEALPGLAQFAQANARPTLRIAVNADSLNTWFIAALAAFTGASDALVDIVLDGEDQTAGRLRSGEVLAAITADPVPVQGCRTLKLGALRYTAVASKAFAKRWFAGGITGASLAAAPMLRFNRADTLQAKWAHLITGENLAAPAHGMPSAQGFADAALAGISWGMNPLCTVQPHLAAGRLVELLPGRHIDVPLYWQHAQIGATFLAALTHHVRAAARRSLVQQANA